MTTTFDKKENNIFNKEALLVLDSIAIEKAIDSNELIAAVEQVIKTTAKTQYGQSIEMDVHIDKKTGNIAIYRILNVVSDDDFVTAEDTNKIISLTEAKKINPDIQLADKITTLLPPLEENRTIAQTAKSLIIATFRELEINKQYNQLIDRVGEIIQGVVRSIDKKGATITVEGIECYIARSHMIKGDNFKNNDRIKVYLVKIEKTPKEMILHISRTHNEFLNQLMKNAVPEIQDGLIEIKATVRDVGSRAKIAVYASDKSIDPIGSCIGIKGSRIQTVSAELSGEKIDVIKWAPETAQYIVNCFAPIQLLRVIVDEDDNRASLEVMDKDLSMVIGRQGQNIKLISKLVNMHLNVKSETDAIQEKEANYNEEVVDDVTSLIYALDIDELLAQLLVSEGYNTTSSIINAGSDKIAEIEGLDEVIAVELILRAQESVKSNSMIITQPSRSFRPFHSKTKKPEDDNMALVNEIKNALQHAGIASLQAIAEMSSDELQGILEDSNVMIPKQKLDQIVIDLRKKLFFNIAKED